MPTGQLLKGVLEGCILGIVSQKETYGYEIVEYLQRCGFEDILEGTVYPIVLRLEKRGSLSSKYRKSEIGPMRKYVTITENGIKELEEFQESWIQLQKAVKLSTTKIIINDFD